MSKTKEKPINRYTADSSNYLKTSHRDDTSQLCCGVVHSDNALEKVRVTGFDEGANQKHQNHKRR
jgi:hypothetical protein